ncbi:MAG: radical SAM protein, partial [Myxococcota bacterium]
AILSAGLDVKWFCTARTEKGFTPEVLHKMYRAGVTMVMWGIESGSKRLLKLMKKGISPKGRLDILRASADAGLWNFAYIFFGFPTETEAEAMATIDLVRENTDIIHSYGRSIFTLGKHSPLMEDRNHYGIFNVVEEDEQFSTNLSHENISGMNGEELMRIGEVCTTLCREAYGDPLWMTLRSRESLHLYLAEHGRDYVQSYRFGEGDASDRDAAFVF